VLSLAGLLIIIATSVLVQHLSLKPSRTSASIPPEEKPALPLPSIPSIAVLPFTNQSGDPSQEYFSDGISDQLINDLSRFPGLFVIARNSSFAYKGKATKESEIGKELGVKYVLEGSVSKTADQLRIGVELVDAKLGTERWTERYDRPLKDIFAVQDEIVGKVVTTLGLLFKLDEMKIPTNGGSFRPTVSLEAYDDYLRGDEYQFRFTKNDNLEAQQWYQKAIKLDSDFSEVYAELGWSYWQDAWNQWNGNPQADVQHSAEMVSKALALDDSNSSALALLSYLDWAQGRFDQAVDNAKRAVEINPNSAVDYMALADALANACKPEETLRAAEKAMRLDPAEQDFFAYSAGLAYGEMGRYQEALTMLERNLAAYPNTLVARLAIASDYVELGREQDAQAEAAEIERISPNFSVASLPPAKDRTVSNRFASNLRKAGLK
jgi:adenylate cyclase